MKQKILMLAFKTFFTVAAIIWLVYLVDWNTAGQALQSLHIPTTLAAFGIFILYAIPCAFRWRAAARMCGCAMRFILALYWYVAAGFFNAFLPTGNGGDVVRGVLAARHYGVSTGKMMGIIVYERIIGLCVAIGFVSCSMPLISKNEMPVKSILEGIGIVAVVFIAVYKLIFTQVVKQLIFRVSSWITLCGIGLFIREMYTVLESMRGNIRSLISIIIFSVLNQLIMIGAGYVLHFAIPGFVAPWQSFFIVIPLVFFAKLIPSIGGYGVTQVGYVVFFSWFGVDTAAAAVYSVVGLLFGLITAIIGGVVLITGKPKTERLREQNEP